MKNSVSKFIILIVLILSLTLCFVACSEETKDFNYDHLNISGFKINKDIENKESYYLQVPNEITEYNLNTAITVESSQSWTVSIDKNSNNFIENRVVKLNTGDNVFYIKLYEINEVVNTFVVTIHRKEA